MPRSVPLTAFEDEEDGGVTMDGYGMWGAFVVISWVAPVFLVGLTIACLSPNLTGRCDHHGVVRGAGPRASGS